MNALSQECREQNILNWQTHLCSCGTSGRRKLRKQQMKPTIVGHQSKIGWQYKWTDKLGRFSLNMANKVRRRAKQTKSRRHALSASPMRVTPPQERASLLHPHIHADVRRDRSAWRGSQVMAWGLLSEPGVGQVPRRLQAPPQPTCSALDGVHRLCVVPCIAHGHTALA